MIQASDIDGGEISISELYYNPKAQQVLVTSIPYIYPAVKTGAKYQISRNKMRQWLAKQDTYTHRRTRRGSWWEPV